MPFPMAPPVAGKSNGPPPAGAGGAAPGGLSSLSTAFSKLETALPNSLPNASVLFLIA